MKMTELLPLKVNVMKQIILGRTLIIHWTDIKISVQCIINVRLMVLSESFCPVSRSVMHFLPQHQHQHCARVTPGPSFSKHRKLKEAISQGFVKPYMHNNHKVNRGNIFCWKLVSYCVPYV